MASVIVGCAGPCRRQIRLTPEEAARIESEGKGYICESCAAKIARKEAAAAAERGQKPLTKEQRLRAEAEEARKEAEDSLGTIKELLKTNKELADAVEKLTDENEKLTKRVNDLVLKREESDAGKGEQDRKREVPGADAKGSQGEGNKPEEGKKPAAAPQRDRPRVSASGGKKNN